MIYIIYGHLLLHIDPDDYLSISQISKFQISQPFIISIYSRVVVDVNGYIVSRVNTIHRRFFPFDASTLSFAPCLRVLSYIMTPHRPFISINSSYYSSVTFLPTSMLLDLPFYSHPQPRTPLRRIYHVTQLLYFRVTRDEINFNLYKSLLLA